MTIAGRLLLIAAATTTSSREAPDRSAVSPFPLPVVFQQQNMQHVTTDTLRLDPLGNYTYIVRSVFTAPRGFRKASGLLAGGHPMCSVRSAFGSMPHRCGFSLD